MSMFRFPKGARARPFRSPPYHFATRSFSMSAVTSRTSGSSSTTRYVPLRTPGTLSLSQSNEIRMLSVSIALRSGILRGLPDRHDRIGTIGPASPALGGSNRRCPPLGSGSRSWCRVGFDAPYRPSSSAARLHCGTILRVLRLDPLAVLPRRNGAGLNRRYHVRCCADT